MTIVGGILAMGQTPAGGGFLAASVTTFGDEMTDDGLSAVFDVNASLDYQRWNGIVIHHLGEPAGDAQYVHRLHQSYGYQGLGYHFLIGNGNGLGDGVIHVGYRWNDQLPGAHVMGAAGEEYNLHSIAICVIGNGDRRPFTDRQLRQLVLLIRALQNKFNIPASEVRLHRDLAPGTTSPGRLFPFAQIREQLMNQPVR